MQARARHIRIWLVALFGAFLFFLALKNTEIAANGIKKGMNLVLNMLVPTLFPFLILSNLVPSLGIAELAARLLAKPARLFFGLTPNGAAALALGWLCGVPVGTVSAITMLKKGLISKEEFDRLLLFSNTPSTGFLIGAVGVSLFGKREIGVVLFLTTLLSSFLTGVFLKLIRGNVQDTGGAVQRRGEQRLCAHDFTDAVERAFSTLFGVSGFVLCFSAITECVTAAGKRLALPALFLTLCAGMLEMTAGVSEAALSLTPEAAFLACAFFAGFSGLSICLQLFSVAEAAKPKLPPYLLSKLVQGALCTLLASLYLALRKPQLKTAAAGFAELGGAAFHISPVITFSGAFLLLVFIFTFFATRKLKLVTFTRVKK